MLGILKMKPTITALAMKNNDSNLFYRLPIEILVGIFTDFDTDTLLTCQKVCKGWNQFLKSNPNLWMGEVLLRGSTVEEIDKRWTRLTQKAGGNGTTSIVITVTADSSKVKESSDYSTDIDWEETQLFKAFPFHTLRQFRLFTEDAELQAKICNSVLQCTQIKELRILTDCSGDINLSMDGKPLANCRLEVFQFTGPGRRLIIDKGTCALLSQAKRIVLVCEVSFIVLYELLDAMKDTLEKLTIYCGPNPTNQVTVDYLQSLPKLILKRLESFSGFLAKPPFEISTPRLTESFLGGAFLEDMNILRVSPNTIKDVVYNFHCITSREDCCEEKWEMDQLREK